MSHLERHNILTDAQHGFHKQWSCESQLTLTARGFEEKSQLGVNLLDFSKAFDKVPYARLLLKAAHYGVISNTLSWIEQFMTLRMILSSNMRGCSRDTMAHGYSTLVRPIIEYASTILKWPNVALLDLFTKTSREPVASHRWWNNLDGSH